MKYPNNIRKKREERNLTQQQLAIAVGMSRSFLGQIETGSKKIPDNYIEKLCIALDVSVEELLGIENKLDKIDDATLEIAIEIIDNAVDAADLTKNQRMDLVKQAYKMITESVEKRLTNTQLEEEIKFLRKKIDDEVSSIKEQKNNIFNFFKNSSKK